ncbi:hypothetical protein NP233_g4571 [Leucocoprinus birnbaumii]|uniref:Uncharacterized protein n=1 Tax=Leucocoprinus birnbaumii TaxID=56174 RepID=A0AAD5YRR4_9AGAR|nr:hypothetical protein NP233_g4571 [Leucocoprinus birnbaumii]
MPTQVSRPPSADPLPSPRTSVDRHPPSGHPDSLHHPPHDPRVKYNSQHREALRLALGSILAPKRPSMPGSRSSSGTATPAYSFSGSSGSYTPYTPSTPPTMPFTPSLEASSSQEHPLSRLSFPHHHPTHPPSKLGRVESHPDGSAANAPSTAPISPPQRHSPPPLPPPLLRSLSQNPSNPPSSRTSPRLHPVTPPPPHPPPAITVTDTADLGPTLPAPALPTADGDGGKISVAENSMSPPSIPPPGDASVHPAAIAQAAAATATATNGTGSSGQVSSQQHPCGTANTGGSGSGTPRAKFLQTLQGKSAWEALIHGSFS